MRGCDRVLRAGRLGRNGGCHGCPVSDSDRHVHVEACSIEVNKATQSIVDVVTDLGTAQITVPSNDRALRASVDREKWIAADQKALDVILAIPGNRLVKTRLVKEMGGIIAPAG